MNSELMRYTKEERRPVTRAQRESARRNQVVVDEVRLRAVQIDGAIALAVHAIDGVLEVQDHREAVVKGDMERSLLAAEIQETLVRQIRGIQRSLFNPLGGL